jgi:hypothetical protein
MYFETQWHSRSPKLRKHKTYDGIFRTLLHFAPHGGISHRGESTARGGDDEGRENAAGEHRLLDGKDESNRGAAKDNKSALCSCF